MRKVRDHARVEAFRHCLLSTLVRAVRHLYPDGLTLSGCLADAGFRGAARQALKLPFFATPVEEAMELARLELLAELARD